jgi:cell division protein ZapE
MQNLSPASRYQHALNEGSHQPDDVQREAVNRLEMIYQELTAKPAEIEQNGGLKAAFGRLLGKKRHRLTRRCAAYICGAASVAVKPG